ALKSFRKSNGDLEIQDLFAMATFPSIIAPQNVQAITDMDPNVTISYDMHPSDNIQGFRIYRDNILIKELGVNELIYTDDLVLPGSNPLIEVTAFRTVNDLVYESERAPNPGIQVQIPLLAAPLNLLVQNPIGDDQIILEWQVPAVLDQNYGYEGFVIQREDLSTGDVVELATISKELNAPSTTKTFTDLTGKPNQNYKYTVGTYVQLEDSIFISEANVTAVFPSVSEPSGLNSTGAIAQVALQWHANGSTNFDGWNLSRRDITNNGAKELIASIPFSDNNYTDYINNPVYNAFFDAYVDVNYEYALKAFRIVDDSIYYSNEVLTNGAPLPGSTLEPLVTNLEASNDIINHVKVCWDWEAAKQSEFIIRRNGKVLDTLPPSSRAYYDYNASPALNHVYGVSSLHQSNESEIVYTTGQLKGTAIVRGQVINKQSGAGVADIKVFLEDKNLNGVFLLSTLTNDAGGYQFTGLPNIDTASFEVIAYSMSADFDSTSI
ncbi:MAG: carboxypeptidase-like regulatory domain-containing protein, partial [Bacteroidota bacterium]